MIVISDKKNCCGCSACAQVCPTNAIQMKLDMEGFLYPVIDSSKCINCSKCNKVCPMPNAGSRNAAYKREFYGAYNKNKEILKSSSSGGIFWALATHMLSMGGVVYGAALGENFQVTHQRASTLEECALFRKSKYLASSIANTYKQAQADLAAGKYVLFSGTPCQIAGLYSYLGKDFPKLYTCDVVCHGVPSKTVFDRYIENLNQQEGARAVSMCWRDKEQGWGPNHVTILFDNGKKISTTSLQNPYQKGFLNNIYLRPSCYSCHWAKLPRVGDISLADFWGYQGNLTQNNVNGGLSIVILSSAKGKYLFEQIKNQLVYEPTTEIYVKSKSRHVYKHPAKTILRKLFFMEYPHKSFDYLNQKYINRKPLMQLIQRIFRVFYELEEKIKDAKTKQ